MERMVEEKWSDLEFNQAILDAKAEVNSQGLSPDMELVESVKGKGFGQRQKVYNYALSHKGPQPNDVRAEKLWEDHKISTTAVDLLIMKPGAEDSLAGAISFARSNGEKYKVFHFLPCRHIDQNDTKSMRTVTADLTFGGKEYMETSVM
jgi:hypothetical protein